MKRIKLVSWNVNGLRAMMKKGFLEWIKNEDADIICLQETKLSEDQVPEELKNLEGYHKCYSSAEKKGYSGVCVYSKEKPASVKREFGKSEFDREGRILIVEYTEFVLFNIYFPNGKQSSERLQYKMGFYDEFLKVANRYIKDGRKIVMCGDVNTAHKEIDLARPKENSKVSGFLPVEREWMDKLVSNGYIDTFRMFNSHPDNYTWWDTFTRARERNVGWRIDYFFISENLKKNIVSSTILSKIMGSDHCPIKIELDF